MGFSKVPTLHGREPRGTTVRLCHQKVEIFENLHFRSSDYPPFFKEAAALFDSVLTVSGLQAKSFPTIDLAAPYAASARLLAELGNDPETKRLREDLLHSAEVLAQATPLEAFHYQTFNRDHFSEQRLAELDFASGARFGWLSEKPEEDRQDWANALFEKADIELHLSDLFDLHPDHDDLSAKDERFQAWSRNEKEWLRDTVAALPDYASRRDDLAELRAMIKMHVPNHMPRTNLHWDTDLFDLLLGKGLRRVGASCLKMRKTSGSLSYGPASPFYEHHAAFNDVDWVWLIQTTGSPQLYFQSAKQPFLEEAVRQKPNDDNSSFFARQQRAKTERRNQRRAAIRQQQRIEKPPSSAPSQSVMKQPSDPDGS